MRIFPFQKPTRSFDESLPEDTRDAFLAADGDRAAFERLVRKYEKFVCTAVYAVLHNTDDCFDVSQEVFLKLYHNIGSFQGKSSFSSWLYRIAKNAALDFLRREKKNRTVSLDAENENGEKTMADIPDPSEKNNPEKAAVAAERKALLYAALDELSDEHKEIILLRDINGYSYEEIGERMQLEAGTVKSRLFRAREALRKKLEEKNYF